MFAIVCYILHWRIQRGGCGGCNPPPLNFQEIVVIHVAVGIDLVVTSSNNACLCALNGVLPSLVKTISQRSRQRYWPLSRRLDRSDRMIQNESRDSKAVMCVCLQRRHVRHNASYVPNAKMPVCPLCSRGLYP